MVGRGGQVRTEAKAWSGHWCTANSEHWGQRPPNHHLHTGASALGVVAKRPSCASGTERQRYRILAEYDIENGHVLHLGWLDAGCDAILC